MRIILALVSSLLIGNLSSAQDTLLLVNGTEMIADSIRFEGYYVGLYKQSSKKPKHINSYRVFSIRHLDGNEEVLYTKDPGDPLDFSPEEMRMFIRGEQDANRFYHNNVNKGVSFAIGFGSSLATFYGLLVPPLYSTVIGSFTPSMEKMKVSDESLRSNEIYCEGYQSKIRKKKIKNSLVGGFAGFFAGFIAFSLAFD